MNVADVALPATEGWRAYSEHVNPQWARPLSLLEMDTEYTQCRGEHLHTADGRIILDFLSGYCVGNAGHNHPAIVDALHRELALLGPMLVMLMYRDQGILTQICGDHFHVLKAAPPLNASAETLDSFISAIDQVLAFVHSSTRFWQDALSLAARAARI